MNQSLSHCFFNFICKKSEKKLHFYIDYKELNAIIVKNYYLLFLISEILNCLCKTRIYIKLDIIHAFNHLHIQEDDEEFIIFHTCFEFFPVEAIQIFLPYSATVRSLPF